MSPPHVIVPATPAFDAEGTPFAPAFDDIYHARQGAAGQARHVFLAGNDLPARWQGRQVFTVLETGFGLGLNFLATWQAWADDAARCGRLHFVSVEAHPFAAHDLARMLAVALAGDAPLAALAKELLEAWPMLVPGLHRLEFAGGRVVLTLAFGDIGAVLPRLSLAADAIYLDGFTPAKNPAMWSRRVFARMSGLAAPEATLATWSAAAEVREGLMRAGFALERRPGYAGKRHMLAGRRMPRAKRQTTWRHDGERQVIVVGAGLAGCGAALAFARRGWQVTLIERHAEPARESSGNPAGTFHPLMARDDTPLARLTRNAFLANLRAWQSLEAQGHAIDWARTGVLQLPGSRQGSAGLPDTAMWPADLVRAVEAEEASSLCGARLAQGGLWFPRGGWMAPGSLCRAQLAAAGAGLRAHWNVGIARCERSDSGSWRAHDHTGRIVAEAPLLVLANALDTARFAPALTGALTAVRGQLSYLPAALLPALKACVCGGAYALPPRDGRIVCGATYGPGDIATDVRAADHADNLARLSALLRDALPARDGATLAGRAAARAVTRDRLPAIGLLEPGLMVSTGFASRGLLWGTLGGEMLAALAEGEPAPVERDLAAAVEPARLT